MAKKCKYPGCDFGQYGGGYCLRHQKHRINKKPKPIRKRSIRKSIKAPDFGFDSQLKMFRSIYFKSPKPVICLVSGRDVTDCMNAPIDIWIRYFAHILNKKNYTYWRLNPANIRIISPEAHYIIDNGKLADREKHPDWNWGDWDQLVEEKKKEYVKFVKENLL